jgi:hypothetical protein
MAEEDHAILMIKGLVREALEVREEGRHHQTLEVREEGHCQEASVGIVEG